MRGKLAIGITLCVCMASALAAVGQTLGTVPDDGSKGWSTYTFVDGFNDTSLIDVNLSNNFLVSGGRIQLANTLPAWVAFPAWERARPINITNAGSAVTNALVQLEVPYDTDMQTDFDDLRLASAAGVPLSYSRIRRSVGVSATLLVKIPEVPAGSSTVYLFYKNPSATDGSTAVLTWTRGSPDDTRVTYLGPLDPKGCWDPALAHGSNQFLTTWEYGSPPEYASDQSHRNFHRIILGRTYDGNGANPSPQPQVGNITVSLPDTSLHAENPSAAYGSLSNMYLVAWEQNPILTRWAVGIQAALVTASGFVYTPFVVDSPEYVFPQYYPCFDPCVAYDDASDRFLVVWGKSDTAWNYNVYGRLYTASGSQIGNAFSIASGTGYQGQPVVTSDNAGKFLVVFEDGTSGDVGPIGVRSVLLNSSGVPVSSIYTLKAGTSAVDCIYPTATYSAAAQRYLACWNTGNISAGDYNGAVEALRLTADGVPLGTVTTVKSSSVAKMASAVPYLSTHFFVSYDFSGRAKGKVVTTDGYTIDAEVALNDTLSLGADYAVLSVHGSNIFALWEDDRYSTHTEVFGSITRCDQTFLTLQPTAGGEIVRVLSGVVTSVPIAPDYFVSWKRFFTAANQTGGELNFRAVNLSGTYVYKQFMTSGEDLSSITDPVIRLQVLFSRPTPQATPSVDFWNCTALVGGDLLPPWTTYELDPPTPNGAYGWYVTPIVVTLAAHDNDSWPENLSTSYRINNGDTVKYLDPFTLDTERRNNVVEFWSEDTAGNVELPHNLLTGLSIDLTAPVTVLHDPPTRITPGPVEVIGSASELASGSGIRHLSLTINDEEHYAKDFENLTEVSFSFNFTADIGETFDLKLSVTDAAGNVGIARRLVTVSDYGLYSIGYLYLFDNPKIGPLRLLESLGCGVAINYDTLYVVLPNVASDTGSVVFSAHRLKLNKTVTATDDNCTDGASCELSLRAGVYAINATTYDHEGTAMETYVLIPKLVVVLLPTQ